MGLIKSILDAFVNCSSSWMYGLYHVSVIISVPIIIITELLNKYSMDHRDEKFYNEHTVLGLIAASVMLSFIPVINIIGAVVGLFSIRDLVIRMKVKKQKDAIRKYYVYAHKLNGVKNNLDKAYLWHSVYTGFNYSDITNSLISIVAKYKKIIGQELYKDMAANRIEYIITLLEECIGDKSL